MNKGILGSIAILTLACTGNAWAASVGYGIVQYDNDEHFWSVILTNHFSQSTANETRMVLDSGSSQFATPWVWAHPVYLDGQPAPAASGPGTQSMTLSGLLPTPPSPGNADSASPTRVAGSASSGRRSHRSPTRTPAASTCCGRSRSRRPHG